MHKISIIIPVYNVEKYLAHCLESVINQTYKNLEIICVNDCSPDNSLDILNQYAQKDDRIKIINNEKNSGQSAARNTGIDAATGEYIYFLDSDDWINNDYIEKMLDCAKKTNCEIIQNTNIEMVYEDGATKPYPSPIDVTGIIDRITALNKTSVMPWSHFFKTDFLRKRHLRFPEGFIHEDIYFHYITKNLITNMYVFKGSTYHYLQRQNSTMTSRKSTILPIIKISEKILDYFVINDWQDRNKICLLNFANLEEIQNAEEFNALKLFLQRLLYYYQTNCYKLNDFEEFVMNTILYSSNFDEFIKNNKGNLRICYLRQNLKRSKK